MSNDPEEPNAIGGRNYPAIGAGTKIDIGGLDAATKQIHDFNAALSNLSTGLQKLQTGASGFTSAIGSIFGSIKSGASSATSSITGMMSGAGSAGGSIVSSMFGTADEKGWAKDLLMFPTRYMRSNILDNRQLALTASGALGPQAFGSMASTKDMMSALPGRFGPNQVLGGSPNDLLALMNIGSKVGAGLDWRYYGNQANLGASNPYTQANSPRAAGYLQSVYEAQRINPAGSVQELAGAVGNFAGNVGAQQQSAFLTGGAFSMIKAGNQQKSISEWATGILKWLANIRPGGDRGKAFTYPELMSQNFPGSNIDAWLTANGVTEDMKTYFWSYALASSQRPGSTADQVFGENAATTQSVAYRRLAASGAQTRTGFELAGQLSGAYANKEQANQWFAELTGKMMNTILPTAMSSGLLSYMQYLPDTIEEMLTQLAERTNLGSLGAGVVGWGSMFPQFLGSGDVGDVGDYGSLGGTSTAGMHPDARKRVDAMMRANPRLKMTSGFRDLGTQQRLKRKGVGRVSGKPSAHTRGMAADLGPASEYPWLVRNARKFGLKSGAHAGEPWHVGMGDVGDTASDLLSSLGSIRQGEDIWNLNLSDTISSVFQSLFQGITTLSPGQTPEAQAGGVAGAISSIMKAIMGVFAQGEVDRSRLAYRDVYTAMVEGTNKANKQPGLPTGVLPSSNWWSDLFHRGMTGGTTLGPGPGGFGPPGGGGGDSRPVDQTLRSFFTQVLTGLGAPVTPGNLRKLGSIAKTEGNRSGTFNPFNSTGGDFPNKFNVHPGVENYPDWGTGVLWTDNLLKQSNTTRWRNNLMSDGSYADWWDATNAFYTWGRPAQISERNAEQMLSHQINAGDVDYAGGGGQMVRATTTNFHNTFNISGGSGVGGGSIDSRRVVSMLADQLEAEMKRRASRSN